MEALRTIQAKLKAPKNQLNKFGGYNYRSCEDILEAVKPLLAETKSQLTLSDEVVEIGGRIYVKATATILDAESSHTVTAYAREAETKKGMDDSQITGTASSYARKYALNGLFLIDDTRDADTDEYQKQQAPAKAAAPARPQAPARPAPKPQFKGGESTPEETAKIKELLGRKHPDGSAIFTRDEMKMYSEMRKDNTAQELIAIIESDLHGKLPEAVQELENAGFAIF